VKLEERKTRSSVLLLSPVKYGNMELAASCDWLTAAEVAQYVKVRARTVLLWTRQGKIKGYALSGTKRRVWRYLRSDIDAALSEHPVISSAPAPFVLSERNSK
jgi:excisionase family DNA binding protein